MARGGPTRSNATLSRQTYSSRMSARSGCTPSTYLGGIHPGITLPKHNKLWSNQKEMEFKNDVYLVIH